MQTLAVADAPPARQPLATRLAADAAGLPGPRAAAPRRFPDEPYRRRFGLHRRAPAPDAAPASSRATPGRRRLRRARPSWTRSWSRSRRRCVADGLARVAYGEVAGRCAGGWPRSASTSPRSRSASTPRSTAPRWPRSRAGAPRHAEVAPGVRPGRCPRHVPGDGRHPGRPGPEACRRYIVSFTTCAAGPGRRPRPGRGRRERARAAPERVARAGPRAAVRVAGGARRGGRRC